MDSLTVSLTWDVRVFYLDMQRLKDVKEILGSNYGNCGDTGSPSCEDMVVTFNMIWLMQQKSPLWDTPLNVEE